LTTRPSCFVLLHLLSDIHDGLRRDESVLAVPTADDPLVVDDGGQLHENVTRGERQLALAQCRIILQRHHAAFDSGRDVFGVAAVLGGALEDGDVVFGRWRQIEALRHDRGGGRGEQTLDEEEGERGGAWSWSWWQTCVLPPVTVG